MIFVGIESPRAASLEETKKTQNLREDIVTSVHRIQAAGIEVMAGMIVGFDNDDASIFEEQFRFIQEARIPISMTGMLNALPRRPHARLQKWADSSPSRRRPVRVHQHHPQRHVAARKYEGCALLNCLYDYRKPPARVADPEPRSVARDGHWRGVTISPGRPDPVELRPRASPPGVVDLSLLERLAPPAGVA